MKITATLMVVAVAGLIANVCGPGASPLRVETSTSWQSFSGTKVPAGAPIYISGIDSVGQQTVWLAESWITRGHSHTGVFRSDDGGTAWRQLLAWDGWPAFQRYFDSANALVVAEFEEGNQLHARLLRTRDGGLHWSAAELPVRLSTGWAVHAIDFVDPSHGWLLIGLGGSGSANCGGTKEAVAIYRTQDGGASWSEVASVDFQHPSQQGLSIDGGKVGLSFRTLTSGYLTTSDPANGNDVFMTQDGGSTWQMQSLPVAQDRDLVVIAPPQWVTSQVGLMGVNISPLSLAACAVRQSPAPPATSPSLQPWNVEPPYGLGQADPLSILLATTDAGQHWTVVGPSPSLGDMSGYAAAGKDNWWLVNASEIGATADGGRSWRVSSVLKSECGFGLVHFMDRLTGLASAFCAKPGPMEGCTHVGTDASEWDCPPYLLPLLMSRDGGVTWTDIAKPVLA
jgi:photosystem II stability/assembly factor-like uncharacterized protein